MKNKLKIVGMVTMFAIILSLFLSAIVFSAMAVAIHFGFYNNVIALGLLVSFATGFILTAVVANPN
jgi:hypothetical protein